NLSGQSVGEVMRFYKLDPSAVLVLHDDLDLAPGKIRVKLGGGHGGHNGLRSLDQHIGKNYRRLRLGIGHPGDKELVRGFVLKDFAKSDQGWIGKLLDAIASEFKRLVEGDDAGFMSRIAHLTAPPKPSKPERKEPNANSNVAGKAKESAAETKADHNEKTKKD
ncbi:MAG: aminoacyl-tRNA hydrolase, partial [Kiloniellales bacterium]|nr:aminoacyl-tRNA hydrolase [Kiloniellales bacterium]